MNKYFSVEKLKYVFYTVSHPVDGYYWIRHTDKGSVLIALVLVVLFSLSFSLNRISASFVVNEIDPRTVDSLTELGGVLMLFALICISNWSVTCLMQGEGRLKDIAIAIGYAMVPFIISINLATIISLFIADGEEAFYFLILVMGISYGIIMMLLGIMQVHNYSLAKTLVTLFLTLVAAFIIIFIGLLLVDLINKIYGFFYSIYIEIVFRV
ncbi:MAG: YIP1 family protein [Anaerolineaceae bacterium]|nr:MAG: YIP1 family protein [Anaerolineaceae bacterium]